MEDVEEKNNANEDMLYLRNVCEEDIDLLFVWANDFQVRQNSFHTERIIYEEHCKWFQRLMNDDSQIQFICMFDELPIGQIRFQFRGDMAEIGYSIAPDMRGKGYGKKLLLLAQKEIIKSYPNIKKLVGRVKKDNISSKKCFIDCGYNEVYTQFEIMTEKLEC